MVYDDQSTDNSQPPGKKKKPGDGQPLTAEQLNNQETAPASGATGKKGDEPGRLPGLYKKNEDKSRIGRLLQFSLHPSRRKKTLIGAGAGGGIVALIISAFFVLIPLKINHIVENLTDSGMAEAEDAAGRWSEKIFSQYIKKHILPSLGSSCISTIDRNCVYGGDINALSPTGRLYQGWKDARIEHSLAEKHGIEFMRARNTNDYTMRIRGQGDFDITDFANSPDMELRQVQGGRADIRLAWKDALHKQTFFKRTYLRYRVGPLLERKYGIRRCIFFCTSRDNLNDWRDNKTKAFNIKLVERVITPNSEMMGLVMECVIIGGCEDYDQERSVDGERRDKWQRDTSLKLRELRERMGKEAGPEAIQAIIDASNNVLEKGFTGHTIEKIAKNVFNLDDAAAKAVSRGTAKFLPVIGWIDLAADFVHGLDTFGPKARRWTYITKSSKAVAVFMLYASFGDEQKSGSGGASGLDAVMVGSMINSLGPTEHGPTAEVSPAYQAWISPGTPTTSAFDLSPTAHAQVPGLPPATYICNDGNPIPIGRLLCGEDDFYDAGFASGIERGIQISPLGPVWNQLVSVAGWWYQEVGLGPVKTSINGILNALEGFGETIVSNIPGISSLLNQAINAVQPIIDDLISALADMIIPAAIIHDNPGGAKMFTTATGGSGVVGAESAHYDLGGKALTPAQVETIATRQTEERQARFAAKPLHEKLFDTKDSDSFVSQLALAVPFGSPRSIGSSFATTISNPFSQLSRSLASILPGSNHKAAALRIPCDTAANPQYCVNPYGTTRYGTPDDDPSLAVNLDTITDESCRETNRAWSADANIRVNPETGVDEHDTTNPCKAVCSTTTALGATVSDAVIEQEKNGQCGVQLAQAPPGGGGGTPTNPGGDTSAQACPADPDISDGGIGDKSMTGPNRERILEYRIRLCVIRGSLTVNVSVAQNAANMIRAAEADDVHLSGSGYRSYDRQIELRIDHCGSGDYNIYDKPSSQCSPPTARPGNSNHEGGEAIDWANCSSRASACFRWLAGHAGTYNFFNLPSEPWHWSIDGN